MSNTGPTPVSLIGAIRLCLLLLFAPARFRDEEARDNAKRDVSDGKSDVSDRAYVVRRAFFESLLLVLASSGAGYVSAAVARASELCATSALVSGLQIGGAALLLWGTLFVRGWEILSFKCVTFTERVNQWLYRALYCAGTAVIVASLTLTVCEP